MIYYYEATQRAVGGKGGKKQAAKGVAAPARVTRASSRGAVKKTKKAD